MGLNLATRLLDGRDSALVGTVRDHWPSGHRPARSSCLADSLSPGSSHVEGAVQASVVAAVQIVIESLVPGLAGE